MADPPLRDSAVTDWELLLLPISSAIRFAELLRDEGGVLRKGQTEWEWWLESWLTDTRYPKCTTVGWEAICDALPYASSRLGGIPVIDLEGNEKLRGTEQTEW